METDYSNLPLEDVNKAFFSACITNQLKNVKAIVSDERLRPYIEKKFLIMAFNWACGENFHEISQYLIFDYNIEQYPEIMAHIDFVKNDVAKNMFILRELNKELNTELVSSQKENPKLKL